MAKPKVLVTRKIPEAGLSLLRKKCQITINPHDRPLTRKELLSMVKEKDAILCLLNDKIDQEFINANPNLKIIANYAVGYDNIDLKATGNIPVTNTPDVLTDAVADLALALMLAASRRVVESDKFLRTGKYKGWKPFLLLGPSFAHKTIGILGLGRIGKAVAKRARGFDMKVVYYDAFRDSNFEIETKTEFVTLGELLKTSDYISIHVPLLPTTKHLISTKQFNMMKRTAVLVNTSRGPVIDEKALVQALKQKKIFAAGLDVFENEPLLAPGLAKLENVVIVPHIGSATVEARDAMAELAANNILAVLDGKPPLTPVKKPT